MYIKGFSFYWNINLLEKETIMILTKLFKYLDKNKEDVLFEILEDDVDEYYSNWSLKYISYLGANNYTIAINPFCQYLFRTKYMYFDDYAYKKCSGNTFSVIDSWSYIKKNIGKCSSFI